VEVRGGASPKEVALDRAGDERRLEPIVESVAVHISEGSSVASWEIDLYSQTDESWQFLGRFVTQPPAITGEPRTRTVILASVPGARAWRCIVTGSSTDPAVSSSGLRADFFISASRFGGCCRAEAVGRTVKLGHPGQANQSFRYATGVGAGVVAVPAFARLREVSAMNLAAASTIAIATGAPIVLPAFAAFATDAQGTLMGPFSVTFAGAPASWFVSWDEA
jgi:hypothetical protein